MISKIKSFVEWLVSFFFLMVFSLTSVCIFYSLWLEKGWFSVPLVIGGVIFVIGFLTVTIGISIGISTLIDKIKNKQ